jgi:hypothetical protein
MTTALPFDMVIVSEEGAEHRLDAHSFLAMPLHRRVRLILERRVALFLRDRPVSLGQALRSPPVREALERLRKD